MRGSRLYKLEYLPSAQEDIVEIARYIGKELRNPGAALHLTDQFIEAAESTCSMPYLYPVYFPVRPLKHEYRKILVGNYLMFYWVEEATNTVTIARAIYAKRDLTQALTE